MLAFHQICQKVMEMLLLQEDIGTTRYALRRRQMQRCAPIIIGEINIDSPCNILTHMPSHHRMKPRGSKIFSSRLLLAACPNAATGDPTEGSQRACHQKSRRPLHRMILSCDALSCAVRSGWCLARSWVSWKALHRGPDSSSWHSWRRLCV